MKVGRYIEGAINRQAALDYINSHQGSIAPEIINALGWKQAEGSNRLARMCSMGELRRECCVINLTNSKGVKTSVTTFRYYALVDKTRDAVRVAAKVAKNVNQKSKREEDETEKLPPWIIRNVDPNRPPIRNQEGIGSGRRCVFAGVGKPL